MFSLHKLYYNLHKVLLVTAKLPRNIWTIAEKKHVLPKFGKPASRLEPPVKNKYTS